MQMEAVGIKVAVRMRPKLPREKKEQIVWECNAADKLLTCRAEKFELVNYLFTTLLVLPEILVQFTFLY